eukprot:m.4916 g.4916  ORF g.4916 m.4916 type:complete len:628 (-) comp4062_c0_seq1:695-2578(-)
MGIRWNALRRRVLCGNACPFGLNGVVLVVLVGLTWLLLYSGQYPTVLQSPSGYIGRDRMHNRDNLLSNSLLRGDKFEGNENALGLMGWWSGHSRWAVKHDISEASKLRTARSAESRGGGNGDILIVGEEVTSSHFFIRGGKHSIHSLFQYIPLSTTTGRSELKFSAKMKHEFWGDDKKDGKEDSMKEDGSNINMDSNEEGAVFGKFVQGDDGKRPFVKLIIQTFAPDISSSIESTWSEVDEVYASSAKSIPQMIETIVPIAHRSTGVLIGIVCVRCKNLHVIDPRLEQYAESEGEVSVREYISGSRSHEAHVNGLKSHTIAKHKLETPPLLSIATQVSLDRMSLLNFLPEVWKGGLGLAVYHEDGEALEWIDKYVQKTVSNSGVGDEQARLWNISLSLGQTEQPYPINTLRNIAMELVASPFVLSLDADFLPSRSLSESFATALASRLKGGKKNTPKVAFVVPAFELVVGDRATFAVGDFPVDKFALLQAINEGTITPFRQRASPKSHLATNYAKWAEATEAYSVNYMDMFEPYVIVPRTVTPSFNEMFSGYGMNKISYAMELEAAGFDFVVLPDAWVVHLPHNPSPSSKLFKDDEGVWLKTRLLRYSFLASLHEKYKIKVSAPSKQ